MDRADFIAQMIAELARQKEEDEIGFLNPRVRSAKEIFESLCFDFPIVTTEEILILSAAINQFTLSSSKDLPSKDFWLNDKFLENLSFLSGSAPNDDDKQREGAVSAFCSNMYFSLPFRLLSMTRRELHYYFTGQSHSSHDQRSLKETELQPWEAICQQYRNMILEGTASALLSIESRDVISHLTNITKTIKGIRVDSSKDQVTDAGSMTLEQYFVLNNSKALTAESSSKHADNNLISIPGSSQVKGTPDVAEAEAEAESECVVISGIAKEIWVHSAFLCRDIMVQRPEILASTSALLLVIGALISLEAPVSVGASPSSIPTAPECMVALILAGVATGITSTDAKHSPVLPVTDGATAALMERDHERSRLRAKHCSEGRAALQKCLEASSPPLLTAVVGICERISGVSTGVDNADGPALLCDIVALYTTEVRSQSVHPHERLITSRAISALVRMWMGIAAKSVTVAAIGEHPEETVDAKSFSSGLSFAASRYDRGERRIAQVFSVCLTFTGLISFLLLTSSLILRIIHTLSLLCLQRSETAAFALRIPHFVKMILQTSQKWPLDGGKWEEDKSSLEPGDAIGLLTALLLSAETLPNTFAEFSSESLSNCLSAALSIMRVGISNSLSIAPALDGPSAADSSLIVTSGSEEIQKQRKKNRLAVAPKGLILSLRMMTSDDVGGYTVRDAVGRKGPSAPKAAVCVLKRWVADVLLARSEAKKMMFSAATAAAVSSGPVLPPSASSAGETGCHKGALPISPAPEHEESSTVRPSEISEGLATEEKETALPSVKDLQLSEEEVDEDSGGDVEEVRHLMKSLQSALQGFCTSKVD
jgi:hypothetical protein